MFIHPGDRIVIRNTVGHDYMKEGFDQVEIEILHKDGKITTHYLDPGEQLEIKVTG